MTQMSREPEEMTLLVLERGAPWPSWASSLRARANHSAVEVQAEDENSEEFSDRIVGRLRRLQEQRVRLVAAGYVCAPSEVQRMVLRARTCKLLLDALDSSRQPELLMGAGDWDADSLERGSLIELWGELSHFKVGASVSVCFDQEEKTSGVFRTAPLKQANRAAPPISRSGAVLSRPGIRSAVGPSKGQVQAGYDASRLRSARPSDFPRMGPLTKAESVG